MILITGANGTIGRATIKQLAGLDIPIRALVRSAQKAEMTAAPGVEPVFGDLADPDSLDKALTGVERALLLSPHNPSKVALENNFIDAAKRTGNNIHIVKISGLATASDSPAQSGRWHGRIEQHVQDSGLPFTFLRPPFFMQNLLHSVAPAVAAHGEFAAPMLGGRIAMIDAEDIATVVTTILKDGEHVNQTYELTGPEALSFAEMAKQLSELLGKPISYQNISLDAMREKLDSTGMPDWHINVVMEFWAMLREDYAASVVGTVEAITGTAARSFAQFARAHIGFFRAPEA